VDKKLCAAALHRQADIAGLLRQPEKEIALIKLLQTKFPEYTEYPKEFITYPYAFCDPAWDDCFNPPSPKGLAGRIDLLENMARLQKDLETSNGKWEPAYISTQMALGRLYEEYCPAQTMFTPVCPDAQDIYRQVYKAAPHAEGVDYAFLKMMDGRFCYEYEGDEVARYQDIVANYGRFLKQYPKSQYASKTKKKYNAAKDYLDKLPSPPDGQNGCSSYADTP
jgi:hypothetical protein